MARKAHDKSVPDYDKPRRPRRPCKRLAPSLPTIRRCTGSNRILNERAARANSERHPVVSKIASAVSMRRAARAMFAGSAERSSIDSASEGFDGTAPMPTEIRHEMAELSLCTSSAQESHTELSAWTQNMATGRDTLGKQWFETETTPTETPTETHRSGLPSPFPLGV